MIFKVAPGIKYYMDRIVADTMTSKRKRIVKKNKDYFIVVTGREGSGKSTLAFQLAKFVDPHFNLDRIAFTPEDFLNAIIKCPKGGAVVFDEAFTGLSSSKATSVVNSKLREVFMEMRQRNLFVFIVLPSPFYLDRYVLLERANVMFNTYVKEEMRGRYGVYTPRQIKLIDRYGRKSRSISGSRPAILGRFTNYFALDKNGEETMKKEYEKKKYNKLVAKFRLINTYGEVLAEEATAKKENAFGGEEGNVTSLNVDDTKRQVNRRNLTYFHRIQLASLLSKHMSPEEIAIKLSSIGVPITSKTVRNMIKEGEQVVKFGEALERRQQLAEQVITNKEILEKHNALLLEQN